jgi:hypothetical protein
MIGEYLLTKLNQRGGHDSDYADMLFGTVIQQSPLEIMISDKITLTAQFLIVGKNVTDYVQNYTINGKQQSVRIINHLENGDRVALIRMAGGQRFYVLEKLPDG